jgi:hypothetical protein
MIEKFTLTYKSRSQFALQLLPKTENSALEVPAFLNYTENGSHQTLLLVTADFRFLRRGMEAIHTRTPSRS